MVKAITVHGAPESVTGLAKVSAVPRSFSDLHRHLFHLETSTEDRSLALLLLIFNVGSLVINK